MPASNVAWQAVAPATAGTLNTGGGHSYGYGAGNNPGGSAPVYNGSSNVSSIIASLTATPGAVSASPPANTGLSTTTNVGALATPPTPPNVIQTYIDQLTSVPSAVASQLGQNSPNNIAEMTLISGVLQAVAQDYQSGRINNLDQSVSQTFNPAWNSQVANANTPQLLRMMVIEAAQANQIQAEQLKQNQRNNVLLAAVLANLVKLNQGNMAVMIEVNKTTQSNIENGLVLNEMLSVSKGNKGK